MPDRVALVTGASKGMGRYFALALADAGYRVAALARRSPQLDNLSEHERIVPIACDITDPRDVETAIEETVARMGGIDAVVANAAIYRPSLIAHTDDRTVIDHFAVNTLGAIWTARAALPHLKDSRGHFVAISSESVRQPFPMLTAYAASKAALETFCEGLRDELRPHHVRVTVLRSGSVAGGTGGEQWSDEVRESFLATIAASGHAAFAGSPAEPQSMAHALLAILNLPRDLSADLVELRSARSLST